MIELANAPVSYGVFDLGAALGADLPGPEELLRMISAAGYTGTDSGPIGMFGRGPDLRDRLARYGLSLAGGWVDLPFADDDAFAAALPGYEDALAFFAEAGELNPEMPPKPTLACSGSAQRTANPGGGPGLGLSEEEWKRYAANVQRAADRAAGMGLESTFHHHACTYVETPEEIDELLSRTSVGLTLDTGHLILGGGDPLTGLGRWRERINHLHLKDARRHVLDRVVSEKGDLRAVWAGKAFVPLGDGDLDVPAVMETILASGYSGWLVIEQDTIPSPQDPPNLAQDHQVRNRQALRRWFP
jgi:inosose dehydratase